MSDENEHEEPDIIPGQVAIVDTHGKVLNKVAAKPGKRSRPPGDFMKGFVTREEVMQHLSTAALAVGQKMYDQFAEETADRLEQMEQIVFERVMARVEARTIRGRVKRLWRRFVPPKLELASDVDAVDVLDPNVHAAAAEDAEGDDEHETLAARGLPNPVVDALVPPGELHVQQDGRTIGKIINLSEQ